MGYFGVESVGKLPKTPEKYPPVLDDLIVQLSEGAAPRLIEDAAKMGRYRALVAAEQAKIEANTPKLPDLRPEMQQRFGWSSADLLRNAQVFINKHQEDGIASVDDLKNILLDPAGLLAMQEPQIEIALSVAYYGADALGEVLKCYQETKTPLSMLKADIEKIAGRLDSWSLSPDKVMEGVRAAVKAALPPAKLAFGMPR